MAFYGVIEPVFAAAFSAAIFAAVVGKEICHFPADTGKTLTVRIRRDAKNFPCDAAVNAEHCTKYEDTAAFRIQTLQPDIKNKYIKFNPRHKLLLKQLEHFPMADHDDGQDALELARTVAKKTKAFRIKDKTRFGL